MKTKRIYSIFSTIIMFAFCSTFIACGSDDDNEKKSGSSLLVGTWHMDEIKLDDTHSWSENTITFYEDGTLLQESPNHDYLGYTLPRYLEEGRYYYNEKTGSLACTFKRVKETADYYGESSWSQTYTVVELSDDVLILSGVGTGVYPFNQSFTYFYTRVK